MAMNIKWSQELISCLCKPSQDSSALILYRQILLFKPNVNVCQQLLRLSQEKEAVSVNIGRRMSYSINQELKKICPRPILFFAFIVQRGRAWACSWAGSGGPSGNSAGEKKCFVEVISAWPIFDLVENIIKKNELNGPQQVFWTLVKCSRLCIKVTPKLLLNVLPI